MSVRDIDYAVGGEAVIDGHEECRSEVDRMKREHAAEVERLQKRIDELEKKRRRIELANDASDLGDERRNRT